MPGMRFEARGETEARHGAAKKALAAVCAVAAAICVGMWIIPLATDVCGHSAVGGEWLVIVFAGVMAGWIVWRLIGRSEKP